MFHSETVEKALFEHFFNFQILIFSVPELLREKPIFLYCYSSFHPWAMYNPIQTSLSCCIVGYFLYVVYHAVEHPLNVNFNLTSEGKSIHPLLSSYIGKHWFHYGHALWINLAAFFTIYLFKHGFRKIILLCTDGNIYCATFGIFSRNSPACQWTAAAIFCIRHVSTINIAALCKLLDFEPEDFTIGTNIAILFFIVFEIS